MPVQESQHTSTRAGAPSQLARPLGLYTGTAKRRIWTDRIGKWIVSLGGIATIGAVLAIFLIISYEAYPLLKPVHLGKPEELPISTGPNAKVLALGVDEYREVAVLLVPDGIRLYSLATGQALPAVPLPGPRDVKAIAASPLGRGPLVVALSDGGLLQAEVSYRISYAEGKRVVVPEVRYDDPMDVEKGPFTLLAFAPAEERSVTVAKAGPHELLLVNTEVSKSLVGTAKKVSSGQRLKLTADGEITALAVDNRLEYVLVGTSAGRIARIALRDGEDAVVETEMAVTSGSNIGVSGIDFLIGDRTLVLCDTNGGVSSWQMAHGRGQLNPLSKVYDFARHSGGAAVFSASHRDKSFITADASGGLKLHHGTTGETLLEREEGRAGIQAVAYAPKGNGLLLAGEDRLVSYTLENPHPEITLRSLFGKVRYEGYAQPDYVWQSSGGSDDVEPKLSLTPLIFGTLKGTFFALIFAVPLALMGALYTSQFMHPNLRSFVKPAVEVMAALPSVVLGFLAGLWLAPSIEKVLPGLVLMPAVLPIALCLALVVWQKTPAKVRTRLTPGMEVFLMVPVVLGATALSFQLGVYAEAAFLGGDYRMWLRETFNVTYDQRNSLVVGFAMGFAVIPIIFTIAEDSLSNVPGHLTAGSLALGATPWQTGLRVVLPTASPGIFSAIMIGFGRAVGETMIVLMATGNTPIMDGSPFNGFRALSANIATELPEAPEHGTLYRVLFLAALLLFAMTFIVNTAAEIVRLRLRKRYRYI